jgi:ribonuclease HI
VLQVDGTPGQFGGGIAGVAAVLRGPYGEILTWRHGCVPAATSNAAEYQAVIFGLQLVLERYGQARVRCLSDSRVAVDQLSGRAAVRAASLAPLHALAAALAARLTQITFVHIPREVNRLADALAWEALEGRKIFAAGAS